MTWAMPTWAAMAAATPSFGPVSPVLDGLAAQGLKLTQGYSNSPVCSPTRFALMTGRYQYRLRGAAEEPINSKSRGSTTLGLPPEHPTLPSLLRDAGYRTALMGKWHLGYPPAFGPLRRAMTSSLAPCRAGWTTSPTAAPPASMTCTWARLSTGGRLPHRPDHRHGWTLSPMADGRRRTRRSS